jgi:sugar lactone lactonase YvrE
MKLATIVHSSTRRTRGGVERLKTHSCLRRRLLFGIGVALLVAVAGGATATAVGSGTIAVSTFASTPTTFSEPNATCADALGNIYVADTEANVIRRIDHLTNAVTVLAGTPGSFGSDNGTGQSARFHYPMGICYDPVGGNLYVADTFNHTIRKVTTAGVVTTLAGSPDSWGSADGTTAARFNYPRGICCTSDGAVLYVCDTNNHTIRLVSIGTGNVATIAGTAGAYGSTDANGTAARFCYPQGICQNSFDLDLYVADASNNTIRRIVPSGAFPVVTVAGSASSSGSLDASGTAARFHGPSGICYDSDDYNMYITDSHNHTIRKLMTSTYAVSTVAGSAGASGSVDGVRTAARFNWPLGLCFSAADGHLYVADSRNDTIRQVSAAGNTLTCAGVPAAFDRPYAGCVDPAGNLYIADKDGNTIRKVTPAGQVSILAGSDGVAGYDDDSGQAALLNEPQSICYNPDDGALYFCDTNNSLIRRVTLAGVVTTFAGTYGVADSVDGIATTAGFNYPSGICFNTVDRCFYVADTNDHTIRKITQAGVVTTPAGAHETRGTSDGTGAEARFYDPVAICASPVGDVYVADTFNHTIRKVTTAGVTTTVAGIAGQSGHVDGAGGIAKFYDPWGIAYDGADGSLYVADAFNYVVRRITLSGSVSVSTPAGSHGVQGTADGQGDIARFSSPRGILYDAVDGNLYVADTYQDTLRKLVVDYAPPATTASGLAADARSGWRTSAQSVSLSRNLDGSTHYSIDGGTSQVYTASFSVSSEGSHAVAYWSVGPTGATETARTGYVNIDATAPTTTVSGVPAGWSGAAVTATFGPSDALSGVASTEYSTNGGATWTAGSSVTISAQGTTTLSYRSIDVAGNIEIAKTAAARIDSAPPTTTVSGVPAGWSKTAVSASFAATDALSGVAKTEYSTNGGATWTTGSSVRIAAQGTTTLSYRSTDVAGNVEATKTATVRVDGIKPVPRALANATVRRGKTVKLRYRVNDGSCPQLTVTIRIYKGGKLKKTLALNVTAANRDLSYSYKCKLAKGKYTWKVYAADPADNVQVKPSSKTLTVK